MRDVILEEYVDRQVVVQFAGSDIHGASSDESGVIRDYSVTGILLERDDDSTVFIPFSAIRLLWAKPKPTWWQRFTGS